MAEITNDLLIQRIINGDEEAFNELYERYHRMVYYVALKTMHSDADAQDVVQDVFLQIKQSIHMVKHAEYLQLWINRITVNKCNMMYRKRKEVLFRFEESDKDEDKQFLVMKQDELPKEHSRFINDQELLLRFIDELPPAQRLMITLMYYEQFSVDEIAAICDIPSGTVKSRLKKARDTLKQKIERYEKQEKVKLDFHGETLPLLLGFALMQEAMNTDLSQPCISLSKKLRHYRPHMVLSVCFSLMLGVGIFASMAKDGRMPAHSEAAWITPKDAYFTIMMWANTPTLMESKQKDMQKYQKYYEILKEDHGVYWSLFLKSGIHNHFETDFK